MRSEPITFRFDMVQEIIAIDETSGTVTFRMQPDPARYSRVDEEGRHGWLDRFDHTFFGDDVMKDFAAGLQGLPMYFQKPKIDDAQIYVEGRRAEIERKLDGFGSAPTYEDKSEAFLATLGDKPSDFVILVVDLAASTQLAQTVSTTEYAKVIGLLVDEVDLAVTQFQGHVLKHTGDGLIAYFTPPSINRMTDLAVDCALTVRSLLYDALFPALARRGMQGLEARIAVDAGEAAVIAMGNPETKQHHDIIGFVVSLTSKIQAQAPAGSLLIGESADRGLHTFWRDQLRPFETARDWPYTSSSGKKYLVFEFAGPGTRSPGN
jgi:class 3 adenylate cyclase